MSILNIPKVLLVGVSALVATACGNKVQNTSSKVLGRPSEDANIASLRAKFASAYGFHSVSDISNKKWDCVQFSAMKEIFQSSHFVRTFDSYGSTMLTSATFDNSSISGTVVSQGTVSLVNNVLKGGVTGQTDRFVLPYSNATLEIRQQTDGTLIEEWSTARDSMVMDQRYGLALAALRAEQWMEPAVAHPELVTFVYAICK